MEISALRSLENISGLDVEILNLYQQYVFCSEQDTCSCWTEGKLFNEILCNLVVVQLYGFSIW